MVKAEAMGVHIPETRAAVLVSQLLESEHLRRMELDDEVSRAAFVRYLDMVDPSKLFLLSANVKALRAHETEMDDQAKSGRLALAEETTTLLQERLEVVRGVVAKRLSEPFDFTVEEELETDPEKLDYAADEAALAERWRKSLKYELLVRLARMDDLAEARAKLASEGGDVDTLDELPDTEAGREAKARRELADAYEARFARLTQAKSDEQVEMFLDALAGIYDPHTVYLPPVSKENFDIQMSGSLEGIGALLREHEHYIRVDEIVPGSASWRQGQLEAGDIILTVAEGVDGEPVDLGDMRLSDVVQLIRGKKGTVVTLTVKKPDERVLVIPITRDVVEVEAAYAKGAVLEHKKLRGPVGYIDVPSFYGNTRAHRGATPERSSAGDVRTLLESFSKRGVESVILDLRGNGGGLLDDARIMTGLFIEDGPVVQTRRADSRGEVLHDDDPGISFAGNVVVLVNRFSASASEIVAGALQDYGRAVVVGTSATFGKGTVQMLVNLDALVPPEGADDDGMGVLKLTRQQFFRVSGASTQHRGVVPDITLADPTGYIDVGERSLDHSIPWSEVEALPFAAWDGAAWDKQALIERSEARQRDHKTFQRVAQRVELLKERRADTTQSLHRETWKAERERERAALEALTDAEEPDGDEPALFSVKLVDYDGTATPLVRPGSDKRKPKKAAGDGDGDGDEAGETRTRSERWRMGVSHDPWVEEALFVLADMKQTTRATSPAAGSRLQTPGIVDRTPKAAEPARP
ncbi:MAG: carboxy terminal-processing peptidase [Haliangiales bacterium]